MWISLDCIAQTDTIAVKNQKGFLFLSSHNYLYDYDSTYFRRLGFHDFFFPCEDPGEKLFLDSNISIVFRQGLRVDSISHNRPLLKKKAALLSCIDTSNCYKYDKFYIIPVTINYRVYQDNRPFVCDRNYYELQVINGARLRFEYQHKAIRSIQIISSGTTKSPK